MNLFPSKQETLVLPYSSEVAMGLIRKNLRDVESSLEPLYPPLFEGVISGESFSIHLILKRPQSFIPIVKGKIDATKRGCIIYCQYELFPMIKVFLVFWTCLTIGMGVFFTLVEIQVTHAVFAYVMGIGNYAIAKANFDLHLKKTRKEFLSIFDQ